jgi:hypothetical protein
MIREARNAIKIEAKSGRVSQVAIDPTETILQGDMVKFVSASGNATKMAAPADGATFLGISDHTNPQRTAGTLTQDYTKSYINVVQSGLVSLIAGAAETLKPFQSVEMVTDAQHIKSSATAANGIGIVYPGGAGRAGKAVAIGDEVKVWLKVPTTLQVWGPREV